MADAKSFRLPLGRGSRFKVHLAKKYKSPLELELLAEAEKQNQGLMYVDRRYDEYIIPDDKKKDDDGGGGGNPPGTPAPPTFEFIQYNYSALISNGQAVDYELLGAIVKLHKGGTAPGLIQREIYTSVFSDFVQREGYVQVPYYYDAEGHAANYYIGPISGAPDPEDVPNLTNPHFSNPPRTFWFWPQQAYSLYESQYYYGGEFNPLELNISRWVTTDWMDRYGRNWMPPDIDQSVLIPNSSRYIKARDKYSVGGWSDWAYMTIPFNGIYRYTIEEYHQMGFYP